MVQEIKELASDSLIAIVTGIVTVEEEILDKNMYGDAKWGIYAVVLIYSLVRIVAVLQKIRTMETIRRNVNKSDEPYEDLNTVEDLSNKVE